MAAAGEIWRLDPLTLQEVVLDPRALQDRLEGCPAPERIWILQVLGRLEEAACEGEALLTAAANRFHPLLALARVYQRQYRWHEAARLHEEALRLARTRAREATVRHEIGRRLFDEDGSGTPPRNSSGHWTCAGARHGPPG